jgi:hypothetical protein
LRSSSHRAGRIVGGWDDEGTASGYGKDLSMYGFEDYTRIKHVMSYIGQ